MHTHMYYTYVIFICTPMRFLPASIHVLETTSKHHQLELYSWLSRAWLSVLIFLWLCFCCAVKGAFYKLTTSGSARVLERCSHRIFGREFWVPWTQKVKPKVESAKTEKKSVGCWSDEKKVASNIKQLQLHWTDGGNIPRGIKFVSYPLAIYNIYIYIHNHILHSHGCTCSCVAAEVGKCYGY